VPRSCRHRDLPACAAKHARRRLRFPCPGLWCRDPARRTSIHRRSRAASAIGRSHAQIDRQLNHDADDGQISRPATVASSQQRVQRPSSLLAVAGERQIAGDAPPAALRRIPQIPMETVPKATADARCSPAVPRPRTGARSIALRNGEQPCHGGASRAASARSPAPSFRRAIAPVTPAAPSPATAGQLRI
jgi:hypothetical protein